MSFGFDSDDTLVSENQPTPPWLGEDPPLPNGPGRNLLKSSPSESSLAGVTSSQCNKWPCCWSNAVYCWVIADFFLWQSRSESLTNMSSCRALRLRTILCYYFVFMTIRLICALLLSLQSRRWTWRRTPSHLIQRGSDVVIDVLGACSPGVYRWFDRTYLWSVDIGAVTHTVLPLSCDYMSLNVGLLLSRWIRGNIVCTKRRLYPECSPVGSSDRLFYIMQKGICM